MVSFDIVNDERAARAYILAAGHYLSDWPKEWSPQKLSLVLQADEDEDTEHFEDQQHIALWEMVEDYMEKRGDHFCDRYYLEELIHALAFDIFTFE